MIAGLLSAYLLLKMAVCTMQVCDIIHTGKISYFGGKTDKSSINKTFFGYDVKDGDNKRYCAIMFNRKDSNKYKNKNILIYNKSKDRFALCPIWDRGPSKWTGRVIDVSPLVMKDLDAKTDDKVSFVIIEDDKKYGIINDKEKSDEDKSTK